MTDITDYKEEHVFSSDYKLDWGYGEWVEEPDTASFFYKGVQCKILRNMGGCFLGYVQVPKNHPWFGARYDDINAGVHGGLTYSNLDGEGWIGFDCGHAGDAVPSMRVQHEQIKERIRLDLERITGLQISPNSSIFRTVYRNIAYVKAECMSLVDQMLEAAKVNESAP